MKAPAIAVTESRFRTMRLSGVPLILTKSVTWLEIAKGHFLKHGGTDGNAALSRAPACRRRQHCGGACIPGGQRILGLAA
jgi:hypothetical protein